MSELLTCVSLYSSSLKLHKGFVTVSSFRTSSLGRKTEKVIFTYFLFCLVCSCSWTPNLAYGLWNDFSCPLPLSSVGCTESDQITFCALLLSILSRSSLNYWFWSALLLLQLQPLFLSRLDKDLWDVCKHKILPLKVLNSSFQISYCQQKSFPLLIIFKIICPL